jgi:uncharacterized cupredoxin-like copper-binding protein
LAKLLWRLKKGPPMPSAMIAGLGSFVLALAVAGCGGGGDEEGGGKAAPASGAPVATVSVKETEFKLDPANAKVAKTGVVAFKVTNSGKAEHNLEVEGPSGEVELPQNIEPGGSATLRVNLSKPGRYEWYCPVGKHKDLGMRGEVEVTGGKSSEGGASPAPEGNQQPADGGY